MDEIRTLSPEQFRKMQLTELDMLTEFDRVCRAHEIDYVLFGGSMLGAVRHQGYIPWDDDADVAMLREDYERFKLYMNEMDPEICYFQDHETDPEYRWGYGKLRRTGSVYVRVGQDHLKCKTGIYVDVFPMDDIPRTVPCQILVNIHVYCLRKILWAEVARVNSKGFWKLWFSLLAKIPASVPFKGFMHYAKKSRNSSPNRVRCMAYPPTGTLFRKNPLNERYGLPKEWFKERAEYLFEGNKLYGTKDYDAVLTYIYGDYMQLPPEDKRDPRAPFSRIKFPDEENEA